MNSVLLIDTIYDEDQSTYSNASLTGEEIINTLKENNFELIPVLRINYGELSSAYKEYYIINSPMKSYQYATGASSEDIILKRSPHVVTDNGQFYISYDTGEILVDR